VLEDVGHMNKGWKFGIFLIAIFFMIATVSAGTEEPGWTGPNVCRNPGTDTYINFENGVSMNPITTQYSGSGVVFSTVTANTQWLYGQCHDLNYPGYWCDGNFWAYVSSFIPHATGRIDFTNGANYVSVLMSAPLYPVTMEAYDASNALIDSASLTSSNYDTHTFDRLTVSHNGIKYVLIHDDGSFWIIDDLCTDATGNTPIRTPEFPSLVLPATMIIGFLGAVLLIRRTKEH